MAKGYLVAHIRVHDTDAFAKFGAMAGPAIKDYGGRVLVRNPEIDHREGGAKGVSVVIEFDSLDQARAFYDSTAYTEARAVRELAAETDLILVEGL